MINEIKVRKRKIKSPEANYLKRKQWVQKILIKYIIGYADIK